ncbi:CNVH-domain-containing protein [Schizopora paradoxa]|uniref:CNVH-domain-containing protein n=1 Tax=Schizopora paradoxa TaxID=27342 RepID=A0A0H2RH11_9AGAM|nr:CNVH-domain-containing protein [Schizopora paradoxa]
MKNALLPIVLLLSCSAFGAFTSKRAAEINFASTCENITLDPSNAELTAECLNAAGNTLSTTEIALDSCIENFNGQLVASATGGFSNTCLDLTFTQSSGSPILSADCVNAADTALFPTSIDLNSLITNNNGILTCP